MFAILFFLHMVGLGMGMAANLASPILSANMTSIEEGGRIKIVRTFSIMGAIGLALLLISGMTMIALTGPGLITAGGLWFKIKILLVGLMIVLLGISQMNLAKARKTNDLVHLAKNKLIGKLSLATLLLIILMASFAYH